MGRSSGQTHRPGEYFLQRERTKRNDMIFVGAETKKSGALKDFPRENSTFGRAAIILSR